MGPVHFLAGVDFFLIKFCLVWDKMTLINVNIIYYLYNNEPKIMEGERCFATFIELFYLTTPNNKIQTF